MLQGPVPVKHGPVDVPLRVAGGPGPLVLVRGNLQGGVSGLKYRYRKQNYLSGSRGGGEDHIKRLKVHIKIFRCLEHRDLKARSFVSSNTHTLLGFAEFLVQQKK